MALTMRKLNISLKSEILRITRINLTSERLVYVLVANKQFSYTHGKSPIVYIGTTQKGIKRIAESAAHHADDILGRHGITEVSARVVTSKGRKHVKTWLKLERAMLLSFREKYGRVPELNKSGKKIQEKDEFKYFSHTAIRNIFEKLKRF
jgi:hypothetical protein